MVTAELPSTEESIQNIDYCRTIGVRKDGCLDFIGINFYNDGKISSAYRSFWFSFPSEQFEREGSIPLYFKLIPRPDIGEDKYLFCPLDPNDPETSKLIKRINSGVTMFSVLDMSGI